MRFIKLIEKTPLENRYNRIVQMEIITKIEHVLKHM